jgi:ABC-type multidrug transport system fused ATPase/permease subunit
MSTILPIAGPRVVRQETAELLRQHRDQLSVAVVLHAAAAVAGLAGPVLLGRLVERLVAGTSTASGIDVLIGQLALAVLIQAVLAGFAHRASLVLGEEVFAELRERFLEQVTRLPLSTVERAGSGDLVSRTTNDVEAVSYSVRWAVPTVIVALVSLIITAIAVVVTGPLISVAVLVVLPSLALGGRWYLRRARDGYLAEMAAYARLNGTVSETLDGARTVAALRLAPRRRQQVDEDIARIYRAERYTLSLRTVWYPVCEFSYLLPIAAVLGWGGWLAHHDRAGIGQVTTVTLYVVQLMTPLDELLNCLDELQVGAASLARIIGIGLVPDDRVASATVPAGDGGLRITASRVRYAYREGHDVLHDVDLTLRPGERLAVVGPSGAGKSTLGRLLAGIHPPGAGTVTVGPSSSGPPSADLASGGPTSGAPTSGGPTSGGPAGDPVTGGLASGAQTSGDPVTGGPVSGDPTSGDGVPLVNLALDELRTQVVLVTQEQHVFVGTVAENLRLARPEADDVDLRAALQAVDAAQWVAALPLGLDTVVGSGGHPVTPAQAQQLALARLVLSDPHTLVLDEATSLLDPRAARHLERSLSAVLAGRTVVAVAHRLHTAHDADRVAVVEGGRIIELGTHHELLERGGSYAALWRSWRDEAPVPAAL